MEYIRCTLCGADQPRELFRLQNDRYLKALGIVPPTSVKVMCGLCGHVYANPQLNPDELIRLYREVYRSSALGYSQKQPSEEYLYWKTLKARRDYRWLTARLPNSVQRGAVLEIGCAEGLLLSMLAKDGWRVMGVEATPAYAEYAHKVYGLEVVRAFFEDVEFDGNRFDLVIALAVLEHVKDPFGFLARIQRLLNPNGALYLTVPNVLRLGDDPDNRLSSPHLCLFTPATLRRMLGKAGLFTLHLDDSSDLLSALVQPGEPVEPPKDALAVSRRVIKRAILRYRVRSQMRRGIGWVRQSVKRGLYSLVGQELGDRVWHTLRRWTGRSSQPLGD